MARLSDATNEEMNAAFDAVKSKLEMLISNFIPSFFQSRALEELHSPRGIAGLLDIIDTALDAVEELRKKKAK